jgi:aldoxime dehydratase
MSSQKTPAPLEDAIPAHLQVARTQPLQCQPDFVPKTISICPRFKAEVTEIVMAVIGVQCKNTTPQIDAVIANIEDILRTQGGPWHHDVSAYIDASGYHNTLMIAYWKSKAAFENWQGGLPHDWWHAGAAARTDTGTFYETYAIDVRNTETTFSHPHPAGYGHLADGWSEATDKHEYFGSARDRIPASQTDTLMASGEPRMEMTGKLVKVTPAKNMCLLRSGQEWRNAPRDEYEAYTREIKPALDSAMKDLELNGLDKGCVLNRYAKMYNGDAQENGSTFSFSAWRSLEHLESWTRKSAEHLEIFARGIHHYKKYPDAKLELWHELYVLPAEAQTYHYYGCHPKTGMMNACGS